MSRTLKFMSALIYHVHVFGLFFSRVNDSVAQTKSQFSKNLPVMTQSTIAVYLFLLLATTVTGQLLFCGTSPTCSSGCVPSSICVACRQGTQSLQGWRCLPCEAGTFSAARASSFCEPCPTGRYTNGLGSTTCQNCSAE